LCRTAHIEKIEAGPKGLLLTFKDNKAKNPDKLIAYLQRPDVVKSGAVKIRPDQKLFFARDFSDVDQRRKETVQLVKGIASL
jgi:transcription-repair coupling factor (superfamily II helicase)